MNKFFLFTALFLLMRIASGQDGGCATVLSAEQLTRLHKVQSSIKPGAAFFKKSDLRYVPLKIHIVGRNNGSGRYNETQLTEAICTLNRNYAPTGFYFYIAAEISYINDDALFFGESSAVYGIAADNKVEGMVNVYFHGYSSTWCGVYFPGPDVVLVVNSCAQTEGTTWTHEFGHFFSLPHTFSGWENNRTPPVSQREQTDGGNCRSAGDGFCDTKPDYVASRWACPYPSQLTDPDGVKFAPDPTLYMNYASDACQTRFSDEQMMAMQADLGFRGIGRDFMDTVMPVPPALVYPEQNDTNLNPAEVKFAWKAEPGAIAYLVQVTRFNEWNAYVNKIVFDTTVVFTLAENKSYVWRVKTLNPGNVCGGFSAPRDFYTGKILPTSVTSISGAAELLFYPNPAKAGEAITFSSPGSGMLSIYNMQGRLVYETGVKASTISLPALAAGLYSISIASGSDVQILKLLVKE